MLTMIAAHTVFPHDLKCAMSRSQKPGCMENVIIQDSDTNKLGTHRILDYYERLFLFNDTLSLTEKSGMLCCPDPVWRVKNRVTYWCASNQAYPSIYGINPSTFLSKTNGSGPGYPMLTCSLIMTHYNYGGIDRISNLFHIFFWGGWYGYIFWSTPGWLRHPSVNISWLVNLILTWSSWTG